MLTRSLCLISLSACFAIACGDDEGVGTTLSTGSATASASASASGGSSSSSSSSSSDSADSADSASSSSGTTADTTGDPTTTTSTTTTTTGSTGPGTTGTGGTTADPADCGNDVLDPGEQCDGGNLGGFDCMGLGYGGGSLSCDPVMCILDTSMCEMGDSTGGTGG